MTDFGAAAVAGREKTCYDSKNDGKRGWPLRGERDQNFIIHWLRDLLCGILIGAGAILPGVSGGVLAVVFDIYRPFMEVLTQPRTAIPKYWKWFPPIALGWCLGFLGFAKGIAAAIDLSQTVTTWLFIGLIVGTLPSLFREAGYTQMYNGEDYRTSFDLSKGDTMAVTVRVTDNYGQTTWTVLNAYRFVGDMSDPVESLGFGSIDSWVPGTSIP